MSQATQALSLKEEGNKHFTSGDFAGAEGLYSKAIIADPHNATLFSNRAMARLKLQLWDSVISDCKACLALSPESIKANYYLSQAQSALGDVTGALSHAWIAHELCVKMNDASIGIITTQVMRAKKDEWELGEKHRVREGGELEALLLGLLTREKVASVKEASSEVERRETEVEWQRKMDMLAVVFEKARDEDQKKRTVPDWVVDDINFAVMIDPVITKTGKSYERNSIMEHLKRSATDPLTREPLLASELRPNLGLREACQDFLSKNGWAGDW